MGSPGNDGGAGGAHVLLLPYPSQRHVHPMLQFAKGLGVPRHAPHARCHPVHPRNLRVARRRRGGRHSGGRRPVRVLVYDAFLPWGRPVAARHGAAAVAFFTQPCAVNVVYGHVWCGRLRVPVEAGDGEDGGGGAVALPGLPALSPEGLPWFIKVGPGPYPAYFDLVMKQFDGLELADDVLVNSFYELEPENLNYWGIQIRKDQK
ncbi:hypothetical protein OsJ_30026 [Oryza sativa Japonica Group]|uniref:Uncharacterized protein n=1 Tax=Oryza sativa subsp. japonica TaxID=39947 RepID=B9G4L0_ORYSJ|nr:hypothetical protein OsJ_30026 [Oryza sativa Japonica Group]